jgi:hypothetical protein
MFHKNFTFILLTYFQQQQHLYKKQFSLSINITITSLIFLGS